ncbi:hypothetical protein quinque_008499 [Culex quinquefasciatus]
MEFVKKLSKKKVFQHTNMEPSEFYTSMLVIPNKIAAIVGLDVFSKDYKTVSANLMGLISIYVLFAYVSVCTVVEVRHDVNDLIYCLVTVGIGLQGVMKIFTFLRYRKDLVWIQDYSKALYKEEEDLKDIFKRHQEHLLYVRNVEKIYRSYFFVLFSSLGATLVLVLYAIVTRAWIAGYTSCIFIIYEFFIFCYLPTLLEMKKEKLQQEIYNLPWYKMTTSDQKSVRLFLEATQQPNCLTMIFYPMNMPSFMEVMKIIYSILTLLLTIRNE